MRRSWPVLLLGFGTLLLLIAASGWGTLQRARGIYREVSDLNLRYRKTVRILHEVGAEVLIGSLLVRDYLYDPSRPAPPEYRTRLDALGNGLEAKLAQLSEITGGSDSTRVERLRREVDLYWNALEPAMDRPASATREDNWQFLREQVVPRREAALAIAAEMRDLARTDLLRQQQEIDRKEAGIPAFMIRMFTATMLLGIFTAGMSIYRIAALETKSQQARSRAESAEQELRSLSNKLVNAQEDERRSISRELHDEVGQMLTALRMELRSLQELRTSSEAEFNEHLEDSKQLAEKSLRAVRDIAMGLRPSMLDDLGLGSAVQWQARQFSRLTGVPVNIEINGALTHLSDRQRTCVYRLVQEALTNCARHAQAKTIRIAIQGHPDRISILVHDDGVGFDANTSRGRGVGLLGIEERVKELGGKMTLTSRPRKGTELSAVIPTAERTVKV